MPCSLRVRPPERSPRSSSLRPRLRPQTRGRRRARRRRRRPRRRPRRTTTTTTTTTPTKPRPSTIAAGVTVAGEVLVGGLSPAEATAAVKAFFARPLTLRLGKVTLAVTPKQLGASAYVGDAIKHARAFAPGANVPLKVAAPRPRLERYARTLAKRFDRVAVDSELQLRNSKPFVTKEQPGPAPSPVACRAGPLSKPEDARARPDRAQAGRDRAAGDARLDRRRDRDPPRAEQAQLFTTA